MSVEIDNNVDNLRAFKDSLRSIIKENETLTAAIRDGAADKLLDAVDGYGLDLLITDFGGDEDYFRGFRAGITHIVDAFTDVIRHMD